MLDRASSFADRDVIRLLQREFVPVALDVWYEQRREDAAGEFFRKVVFQREGMAPDRTTQGLYAFTPDGKLLAGWNNRDAAKLRERLRRVHDDYAPTSMREPSSAAPTADGTSGARVDSRFERALPDAWLVVEVHSRILDADWPKDRGDEWESIRRAARGLDHLWITKDEVDSLARGDFPASLATRIARFHCIDNTRGEPPAWEKTEIERLRIDASRTRDRFELEGEVRLRSAAGDRGYDARVRGVLEVRADRVTRFDLVIRGAFFGEGEYTPGAPPGRFTLGIAFTLPREAGAEASFERSQLAVPPQGARWLDDYLGRV